MRTTLAVIDKELQARKPVFQQLLPPSVSAERLMRTVLMAVERNPRLLECQTQSLMNAATTAAVLGLEVDGITGQASIVPFREHATLIIGNKGFNTLAARSGYTITGGVVREGDPFDYELGSQSYVRHKPVPGNRARIVGAWACATSLSRPPIVRFMPIEDIEAVKARSMGARKPDSPWNDPHVGYPAMVEKTVKRRLARDMPMSVMQQAAALDSKQAEGKTAWLEPDGNLRVVGEDSAGPVAAGTITDVQPEDLTGPAHKSEWPQFRTTREFVAWSKEHLEKSQRATADSWKKQFSTKLDQMLVHPRENVRAAANDLVKLYEKALADGR